MSFRPLSNWSICLGQDPDIEVDTDAYAIDQPGEDNFSIVELTRLGQIENVCGIWQRLNFGLDSPMDEDCIRDGYRLSLKVVPDTYIRKKPGVLLQKRLGILKKTSLLRK